MSYTNYLSFFEETPWRTSTHYQVQQQKWLNYLIISLQGIIHSFDTEYVDVIIRTLLQLRAHATRMGREINNGLITSEKDLSLLMEGMQDIDDKLVTLMRENGFIRNNFEYGLNEIRKMIEEIKDSVYID